MAELDLPTGNTGGEQHLAKFLATLTQLVDVLGKAGPGGDGGEGGSSSPAAPKPDNSGKAIVGATRKLFNDVANAFRPLKSVLASFSKLQATPQPAGNMALPAPTAPPESPAAAPAPTPESSSIHDAKYDKYFKPDQFTAFRKTDAPAPTAPPVPGAPAAPAVPTLNVEASAPASPEISTGPRVIQVQDASVGIEQATVKMNGGTNAAPKTARPLLASPKAAPPKGAPKAPSAPKAAPPKAAKPGAGASAFRATTPKARPMTGGGFSGGFFHRASKMRQQAPASPASPNKAFSPTAARFNIANGLFQGRLMLPPAIVLKAAVVNLHAPQMAQPTQAQQSPIRKPQELTRKAKAFQTTAPKVRAMKGVGLKGGLFNQAKNFRRQATATPSTPAAAKAASKAPSADPRKAILLFLARLGGGMQEAARALTMEALKAGKKMSEMVGSGVAAPFKQAGSMIEGVGGRLANAFANPMAAFKDLSGLVMSFVQAINPAAVMGFNFAMRDATAVIGQALAPVMTIATEVVREWANTLAPIARQMAPLFAQIARAFGDMFISQIRLLFTYFQILMPIIKSLLIVLSGLARIVAAVNEGLMVILSGFVGSFDGVEDMVQKVVDGIVDFTKQIVRATVAVVAMVAKMVGATGFLENMRKAAEKKGPDKEDTTGRAVPTGANFTAAESFGKSIATASFTATSAAAAPKKTDDFLDQIAKDMDMIANTDIKQVIIEAIESASPAIARAIAGGAKETLKAAGNAAYEWNPLKGAGEWLGDKAAGLMGY